MKQPIRIATYISLTDKSQIADVREHIEKLTSLYKSTKIYVGTDSQNKHDITHYVTAIVIHFHGNSGGHVIYSEDKVPRVRDRFTKLWGEVTRSVDVANFLRDECKIPIEYIDLDLNANAKWDSNKVLAPAVGYVKSFGYESRFKPGEAWAVRIADTLCR